ncbi:MAG: PaaI family thioesterase [Pseudomonadales bacterium]|nr:PaaI family thioesterase [Pseudomonadales bacterium]
MPDSQDPNASDLNSNDLDSSDGKASPETPASPGLSHPGFQEYQFNPIYMEEGKASISLPYNEKFVGDKTTGSIHGGIITLLMDTAGGMCVMSTLKKIMVIATLDLRMDYLRPTKRGMDITAEVECYELTKNVAFVRGFAYEGEGDEREAVAHMTAAFMLNTQGPNFTEMNRFSAVSGGEK